MSYRHVVDLNTHFGQIENLRFEVLMATTMKNTILCCDATQSSKNLLMFQINQLTPSSGYKNDFSTLMM